MRRFKWFLLQSLPLILLYGAVRSLSGWRLLAVVIGVSVYGAMNYAQCQEEMGAENEAVND